MRCRHILFAALIVLSTAASAVRAEGYGQGCGSSWWIGGPYNYIQQEHIPYYSLHPPVYYSMPVPRSYGYSPFAYPPGTMTPEVVVEPMEIKNPYVPERTVPPRRSTPKPKPRAASERTANILINPFVRASHSKSPSPRLAR